MRRFLGALGFLTVVPLPARWQGHGSTLGTSVPFFPVVGLAIGLLVAAIDAALSRYLPSPITTVLAAVVLVAVSGGLHLDGLADTADGFFSSRSREAMLAIMKDSRTGPMGVAAVVLVVALKLAAIGSVPRAHRATALLLMPLAGRCAIVVCMAVLRYARPAGLGTSFAGRRPWAALLVALGLLVLVGSGLAGRRGLVCGAASLALALLIALMSWRKIVGFTGDTLGAACETVEIIPALVMSARMEPQP